MAYDLDLRIKVIVFIESGGGITKASKTFRVGRATVYRWLGREELAATKVENRQRKINRKELEEDVKNNPDMLLKERAKKFGVTSASLSYQFKKMKITRKKTVTLSREGCPKASRISKNLEAVSFNIRY
ncbi:transposase [Synechocystis sp. PCC 6803]|uniref:Transposase n=1 Tax=Synechocystis sp. (strain ATCC 27184 / PCC 6803 / Kazusa) TaxID=1111708 RepID=P74627_SYNY3|nr:transposase [Synechocystis sp. PCC 6803]BAL30776.1 transposase [Synechocystis sp. PCC 6803 substr. GT-I]BAL33945.1 transposase [Synechocystis sp. PCC 6803 substr. PCC-N]BAL37114.1 transposase [Synechocystis sp. PCC 6803 substr. PCC-P]BAM53398.1 transposase [Synechocystis sp. PCC 6803] [Bacillus subtilis BEST7613]